MKKQDLRVVVITLVTVGLLSSCEAWQNELGRDLLPPGDQVFLFHDTIFDIEATTVSGDRVLTSDVSFSETELFLLGALQDTIVGSTEAGLITQFNSTTTFIPAANTQIDTLMLRLQISSYDGNATGIFTIRVFELTERIYFDSVYYSDFDPEGRYNPVPLAEKSFKPAVDGDTVDIMISDQAFIQKFLDVQTDTALFASDSLFKDYFNGVYLTASSVAEGGAMARVALSGLESSLIMHYANDSTDVDTLAGPDFQWAVFGINQYFSQKINTYNHEVDPGSFLATIIDQEKESPYCIVQGMQGARTKLSFTNIEEWSDGEEVAITSANLVLDLVPGELAGLDPGEMAQRLMLYTVSDDGTLGQVHDYVTLSATEDDLFGGMLIPVSEGMFSDTTYTYRFKMPLHFQGMVDGSIPGHSFRLGLHNGIRNPKFSVLWSNLHTNPSRIRLEVVYLKL